MYSVFYLIFRLAINDHRAFSFECPPLKKYDGGIKARKEKKKRAAIGKRVESPKRKAVGNLGTNLHG